MSKALDKVRTSGSLAARTVVALGLGLGLATAAAPAAWGADAHAGSEEEQRACTPDVFRLCTSAIPDDEAIVACLKSKKSLLSPACAEVFADRNTHARSRR